MDFKSVNWLWGTDFIIFTNFSIHVVIFNLYFRFLTQSHSDTIGDLQIYIVIFTYCFLYVDFDLFV